MKGSSDQSFQKTMVTVFFGADSIALFDIVPPAVKFTSDYFCTNVIEVLEGVVYPNARRDGTVRRVLHFDNAPVHNAEKVQSKLDECSLRRLKHRPIHRLSHRVISFLLVISTKRCNSSLMRLRRSLRTP
jgi:hypothetical protein